MPTLGRFIRRRRIELGMTQEQLALLIDVSVRQSEISRLENDRIVLPRRERLERIADALQVPIGELLARSGWTGADAAFASAESSPLPPPPTQQAATVLELLDEIRGLIEEAEQLIQEGEGARAVELLDAANLNGAER